MADVEGFERTGLKRWNGAKRKNALVVTIKKVLAQGKKPSEAPKRTNREARFEKRAALTPKAKKQPLWKPKGNKKAPTMGSFGRRDYESVRTDPYHGELIDCSRQP